MTWLTAKHILKKIWTYIKNYWWAGALIIIGFVLHKFFVKDKDYFRSLYEGKVKQNEEEIKVLNEAHEEEVKEKLRAQHDFKLAVDAFGEMRKEKGEQIKRHEKKRIKEIIEMPDNLRLHILADEFGLEIVEVVDE
jgi:hypothetical protein